MITPDMIPDEVVNALWRNGYDFGGGLPAQRMKVMRDAIAAALNAWPHSYSLAENDSAEIRNVAVIILPLLQENSDE